MKELINIAKNIKAPGIFIYLKEGHFEDEHKCKAISNKIEYLNLKLLVKHAEIHYEPDPIQTRVQVQSVTVCWCGVLWCSVLQCVKLWCSVLQCGAVWCSVVQCCAEIHYEHDHI